MKRSPHLKKILTGGILLLALRLFSLQRSPVPYAVPNPFNLSEAGKVRFMIPVRGLSDRRRLNIDVYSSRGVFLKRTIAVRSNRLFVAEWDGMDREKRPVLSGIYFLYIKNGATKKKKILSLIVFRE